MAKEYDIYRDSYIRFLGYTNEIGEAFRPLVPRYVVKASYGVAISYVCADVYDKAVKCHKQGNDFRKIGITMGDVFIWQMLASVIVPGITINRITWGTARLLQRANKGPKVIKIVPTMVGIASIPLIISPIDRMIDALLDVTYRKWFV